MKWFRWRKNEGQDVDPKTTFKDVLSRTSRAEWIGTPIEPKQVQSPWLIGLPRTITILQKVVGESFYSALAREGINTRGANGVFFVDAWEQSNRLFIKNRPSDGRNSETEEVTQSVEDSYLFPLLRGENVGRFRVTPEHFILLPHASSDPHTPVGFTDLPPKTREFLAKFRKVLEARTKFRNFDPTGDNWHGLYSVLQPTFASHKVVWREMGLGIIAAAVGKGKLPNGKQKLVIPDHKLFLIPCESSDEADFVAGVLNSSIANLLVASYAVSTGISAHILNRIPLPRFQDANSAHKAIAPCARDVRVGIKKGDDASEKVAELNLAVGKLLGLDAPAVKYTVAALKDFGL